ncbi:bifunctional ADP-dependent NAD(P)H-hydrate dehydratase/NAD(P)H-hydrate epimerase [Legionella waltersii]|uniref:Bifunctional NAD(P)H-hydrate repair enzyme n=1 Tax=Legionella waltersii TaxID=66969 RepID=A0A0W1AD98_9GAMM|nr:bifunctional ADP-dependent NAD(P)H-hydrate dehydratase/NAD(P)H-hydrate epimerase [Legionella waltersii]KTD79297.1 sugar kinase [Legionella waltersii]SNV12948.1 sugar kinase [Legionella waltersii]
MSQQDKALYRCEQIRACELLAKQLLQRDEHSLMLQAGTDAFTLMKKLYPKAKHIAVFCGVGNNAGDGYVLARIAHEHHYKVTVYQCRAIEDLPPVAHHAAQQALDSGVEFQSAEESLDNESDLIIDALLGVGLKGPVHGLIANAITQINDSQLPVMSLDVPSGLNADSGVVDGFCVKATSTMTFIGLKTGMYTMDGPDVCGDIYRSSLDLEVCLEKCQPHAFLLADDQLPLPLPLRKKNSHKGKYGHVLVIGSGVGMPGAVSLVAKAALRTGAGLVTVATWPEHVHGPLPLIPEAMIMGVDSAQDLKPLLAKATVCVLGPGLGESDWATELFNAAISAQLPMVMDASALRLLAAHPQMDDNWVLTPHAGEASSLLLTSVNAVQNDRYHSAESIQQQYGGVVVLKGVGTIIQTAAKEKFVCPKGNPGMASAGMGDVLSGIIAGFCAQGMSLSDAAKAGVWAHAYAGDKAAEAKGEIGLLATDLFDYIPGIIN